MSKMILSAGVMSMMSEMLCGSPDAMSFKDEFGIADSIGETDTSSPQYQKELNELPGNYLDLINENSC